MNTDVPLSVWIKLIKTLWPLWAVLLGGYLYAILNRSFNMYPKYYSTPQSHKNANSKVAVSRTGNVRFTPVQAFNDYDFPWHNVKAALVHTNKLSGRHFEEFLALLFKRLGYTVQLQKGFQDHGGDLVITDKYNRKFVVQAKKLESSERRIGAPVLGEILRAKHLYKCQGGFIITNQFFTVQMEDEAEQFKEQNIHIWDRAKLAEMIKKAHSLRE